MIDRPPPGRANLPPDSRSLQVVEGDVRDVDRRVLEGADRATSALADEHTLVVRHLDLAPELVLPAIEGLPGLAAAAPVLEEGELRERELLLARRSVAARAVLQGHQVPEGDQLCGADRGLEFPGVEHDPDLVDEVADHDGSVAVSEQEQEHEEQDVEDEKHQQLEQHARATEEADQEVVQEVQAHRGRPAADGSDDLHQDAPGLRRDADPDSRHRREGRVAEPAQDGAQEEDDGERRRPALSRAAHDVEHVLRQGEAEPDDAAVDRAVEGAVELFEPERRGCPYHQQEDALERLLHRRRDERRGQALRCLGRPHGGHDDRAADGVEDQREERRSEGPPEEAHHEQPPGLGFVAIDCLDGQPVEEHADRDEEDGDEELNDHGGSLEDFAGGRAPHQGTGILRVAGAMPAAMAGQSSLVPAA